MSKGTMQSMRARQLSPGSWPCVLVSERLRATRACMRSRSDSRAVLWLQGAREVRIQVEARSRKN